MKKIFNNASAWLEEHFVIKNLILALSICSLLFFCVSISLSLFTRNGQRHTVPSFYGMTLDEVALAAEEFELRCEVTDSIYVAAQKKGVVLEQYPKAGSFVKSGRRIFLTTNTHAPKMVPLPYIVGFSLRQAKNRLVASGFEIDQIVYKDDLATYNVLQQSYKGKDVESTSNIEGSMGDKVSLTVGLNPVDELPIIPNVVGLTIKEAKSLLWDKGFNVAEVDLASNIDNSNISNAKIFRQNPLGARKGMYGRSLLLWASVDKTQTDSCTLLAEKEIENYLFLERRADSLKRGLIDSLEVISRENF